MGAQPQKARMPQPPAGVAAHKSRPTKAPVPNRQEATVYQPQPTAHGTFEDPTTGLRIDSEPAPPIGSPTRANKLPRGLANPSQMGCAVLNGPSMALLGMSQRAFQEHFGPPSPMSITPNPMPGYQPTYAAPAPQEAWQPSQQPFHASMSSQWQFGALNTSGDTDNSVGFPSADRLFDTPACTNHPSIPHQTATCMPVSHEF